MQGTIPWPLHVIVITGVVTLGVLLVTAITRVAEAPLPLAIPVLLGVYWRLRAHPIVVACYFGIAMATFTWIVLCQSIVQIDRSLGTRVSQQLRLGPRLAAHVASSLPTEDHREVEPCCSDALMWRYRPGSRYRSTFDCPRCNPPYETIVDQTGYLNRPACPPLCYPHIDMFLAGDSVLQGMGGPSVVEDLRRHTSLRLWNLSIQAYGPREKVNALLNYALPHSPRWLVVEFFAGNDVAEAIRDDVCQDGGDFRCRYNGPAIEWRLAQDPFYARLFDVPTDRWARVAYYAADNLTLAMSRHVLEAMKAKLKATVHARGRDVNRTLQPSRPASPLPSGPTGLPSVANVEIAPWLALGGSTPARVREVEWPAYIMKGLALTQREYKRLTAALVQHAEPPQVILLYNPAPYEVYRSIGIDLNSHAELLYPIQRESLRVFANSHGWHFLDLTEPLRGVVRHANVWLYGRYDQSHWSPEATPMVADILARELSTIVDR